MSFIELFCISSLKFVYNFFCFVVVEEHLMRRIKMRSSFNAEAWSVCDDSWVHVMTRRSLQLFVEWIFMGVRRLTTQGRYSASEFVVAFSASSGELGTIFFPATFRATVLIYFHRNSVCFWTELKAWDNL